MTHLPKVANHTIYRPSLRASSWFSIALHDGNSWPERPAIPAIAKIDEFLLERNKWFGSLNAFVPENGPMMVVNFFSLQDDGLS